MADVYSAGRHTFNGLGWKDCRTAVQNAIDRLRAVIEPHDADTFVCSECLDYVIYMLEHEHPPRAMTCSHCICQSFSDGSREAIAVPPEVKEIAADIMAMKVDMQSFAEPGESLVVLMQDMLAHIAPAPVGVDVMEEE